MEVCVRYAGCHRPQVSVSVEVCVRHAGCHRYLSLWRYVYYYTVWGGVIYVQVYRQKVNAVRACVRGRGQMAILVSLLYGGGGEVWEPEGNGYTRLTTTLWSLSIRRGVSLFQVACDSA